MTHFEALLVLRSSDRPLSTSEILERIQQQHLVPITGRTPLATLPAALYRHLGKHPELRREHAPGEHRAMRGTVRWSVERLHTAAAGARAGISP